MGDTAPTELAQFQKTESSHPTAEKFGQLREEIKNRIPAAEKTILKSGLASKDKLKRLAINMAGEALRKDMEEEKDPVTGALNLKGFERKFKDEVARSSRNSTDLAVVYLDANNLKKINDTLGHEAGTTYLKEIGQTLLKGSRTTDTVSRWGGDEFGVLLPKTNFQEAQEWWRQIEPLLIEKNISIGAGVSLITPENLKDPTQFAQAIAKAKDQADKALYVAKPLSKITNGCVMITADKLKDEETQESLPKAA